jgi:integrase
MTDRCEDAMTLARYLREWHAGQRTQLQPTTWKEYGGQIERYLVPTLGDRRLDALDVFEVETILADLLAGGGVNGKPLSLRTVEYAHGVLRCALNDAVDRGLVGRNVASVARPPRVDPFSEEEDDGEVRVWDGDELRAFLAYVAGHRWRPLWRLAASTGMRRGEVLGLRWSDVELDDGVLLVRRALSVVDARARLKRTKTLRERRIGIDGTLVAALKDRRERQEADRRTAEIWRDRWGLVFTHVDGAFIDPMDVTMEFRRLVRAAPVPIVRFHDLRHVHATLLLAEGVPVKVVSERLGHAAIQTTLDRYAHVIPGQREDAVRLFERLIAGRDGSP